MAQLLIFPGFRDWWRQTRATFSPSFVERMDALIAATLESDPAALLREWQRIAENRNPTH